MATRTTPIRDGYDTWVSAAAPTAKHPGDIRLRLASTTSYGFVYMPLGPELRNSTILSVPFHIFGRGTSWGTPKVTAQRITEKWDAATLQWNNLPSVGTTAVELSQTNPNDLTEWVLDLAPLVREFASGARWWGFRLAISSTTVRAFNSLNATGKRPWMEVRWTDAPAAPVDLTPAAGRAVSTSRPLLSWANDDSPDGSDFTDFEVQIDPAGNGTSPAFASPTISSSLAQYDLTQSSYAGLAAAATTQWRVRVRAEGLWSAWSDWATFTRVDKGSVTITTPLTTVAEYTPPISWTTTFTQKAWRIRVFDDSVDPTEPRFDTGRQTNAIQDFTLPGKDPKTGRRILVDGRDYRIVVLAWDDVDREGASGDPARATVVVHYADDPTPNPVTSLVVTQVPGSPYVDITWNRDTTPDAYQIVVDDRVRRDNIPGADPLISGTSYSYRYKDAPPGTHDFKVKPTVNGKTAGSPTYTLTTEPTGLWIIGPDDLDVLLGVDGDDFASLAMPDRGTTFELPQALTPVRVTQGVGGLRSDNVQASLWEWPDDPQGRSVDFWKDRLLQIKKRAPDEVTLYLGNDVITACVYDIFVGLERDEDGTRPVSFGCFQTGVPDWLD